MTKPTLTRQTFLLQISCAMAALAIGCDSGDSDEDDTDADAATDSTGSTDPGTTTTNPGTTSAQPTDPVDATTSGEASSGSTGGDTSSGDGAASGSSSGGESSVCRDGVVVAAISANHGHALEIPLADIEAGVETTYDASGTSGHCHQVILTAADYEALRAGETVTKISCNGGDHVYALNCSKTPKPPGDPDCSGIPNSGSC